MGLDLDVYGNHNVNFGDRNVFDIANEIKNKLNSIVFINDEFMFYHNLFNKYFNKYSNLEIEDMKINNKWIYYENDLEYEFNEYEYILFTKFYGLDIYFSKDKMLITGQNYKFDTWFEYGPNDCYVNEWRKYYKQVLTPFDGDTIIYFPGYGISKYPNICDLPFKEFEQKYLEIIKKCEYGEDEMDYFNTIEDPNLIIDKLDNINWEKNFCVKCWYPDVM